MDTTLKRTVWLTGIDGRPRLVSEPSKMGSASTTSVGMCLLTASAIVLPSGVGAAIKIGPAKVSL
jgi:hypothetical protein